MIKTLLLLIFLVLGFSINLCADMDSEIEAIRKAPISERFKLMNAFKKKIIKMQEKERIDAISKLKDISKSKYGSRALKELKQRQQNKSERYIENATEAQIENATENQMEYDHDDDD